MSNRGNIQLTATSEVVTTTPKFDTREAYLVAATDKLRPWFAQRDLEIQPVQVSCGFPAKSPMKTLGECWHGDATDDGTRQIFISPLIRKVVDVIGTLAHELLHASLPDDAKHGPKFKEGMKKLGLEGNARSAGPGPELQLFIESFIEELGEYPNTTLKPKERKMSEKAASKKSFKLFCPRKRNGDKACLITEKTAGGDYNVTASRKSLKLGFPLCPCGAEMEMESEDYELYKLAESV